MTQQLYDPLTSLSWCHTHTTGMSTAQRPLEGAQALEEPGMRQSQLLAPPLLMCHSLRSDHWGRKPFMLLGILLALGPMLIVMMHLWGWITIYWYVGIYW